MTQLTPSSPHSKAKVPVASRFALAALFAALAAAALPAQAVGRLADVTVVDRDTGATLPLHYHRGEYWVAGRPGARYAISVRNRLDHRVLAVTSVDGVNILSGDTANFNQSGYVFSPNEHYQLTGWRKSNSEVAAFEFSASGESYAGRTGRPANVGVIGVALFREKPAQVSRPEVLPAPFWAGSRRAQQAREEDSQSPAADSSARSGAGSAPAAPPAPAPVTEASAGPTSKAAPQAQLQERESASPGLASRMRPSPLPAPKLGTAHGERETSVVSTTSFERLQDQPNEIIRIRYDSRENLVASGVIREPARMPAPNAFPDAASAQYVPDPPARRY
ncbi:MAG: hypothetical protein Q7T87_16530 [Polaromonas sp.]|nr:hypothetical protein [Polaromonas sp.]